jgi:hypothetical protein
MDFRVNKKSFFLSKFICSYAKVNDCFVQKVLIKTFYIINKENTAIIYFT